MSCIVMSPADVECVVPAERCPHKQGRACHGAILECWVNWISTDPEDLEPYADYLAEVRAARQRGLR